MKIASFYDSEGTLFVDCTECERGMNGSDKDKCSSGMRCKKPLLGYCCLGTLISSIDKQQITKEIK